MTFKEWKEYWKKMDWSKRWFPFIMLIRPIADNFYELKKISPFISPLYILGVLTPVLIIFSLVSGKLQKKTNSTGDGIIRIWGIVVLINCALILISVYSIENLGNVIRFITPPLLYFYCRRFIQSKEDLVFILQTFLYSCIIPFCMLGFETFVHPLNPELLTEGRGGGVRIRGAYGDCMNYAVYLISSFVIYSYFLLDKIFLRKAGGEKPDLFKFFVFFSIVLVGIISIRHVASWGVFLTMLALVLSFNAKKAKGLIFIVILAGLITPFFARSIYEKQVRPLIDKELEVMSGKIDVESSFNGRMLRWEKYFEIWNQMPGYTHLFGVAFSGFDEVPIMVSGGMHSDYVRVLFLTGIFGLLIYVVFVLLILFSKNKFRPAERFLILASTSSLILYSVTTLPLIYTGYLEFLYPVFAFALLSKSKAYGKSNQKQISLTSA